MRQIKPSYADASGQPQEVDRNPDGVHDRELDRDLGQRILGQEGEARKEGGVYRIALRVDNLQH